MDPFMWALAFIIMVVALSGGAVGCVFFAERGKTKRAIETERTRRQGQDNLARLEEQKLMLPQLGAGAEGRQSPTIVLEYQEPER